MLVMGCVLWGQQITPKCMWHDTGWSQGFLFTGMAPCLRFCESLDLADVAVTTRGLYEPLQINCCSCCESLQILADRSRLFSIWFSKSLWIYDDLRRLICRGAQFESQPLPLLQMFQTFLVSKGRSGQYFSTDLVQCDGASKQLLAGVVPAHGVAMDTFLPWPEVLRPPDNI